MRYRVLALHESGDIESRLVEADGPEAARRCSTASGVTIIDVAPMRGRWGSAPAAASAATGSAQVDVKAALPRRSARFDLDLFCQELLALLSAGIPVGETLETLAQKDDRSEAGAVPRALLQAVREGLPLSSAMALQAERFPALLTESMRASERTSDYVPALTRFVRYRRLTAELRAKAVSAAIYPLLLLAVSGAVLLFLIGYVVPRFATVYAEIGDRLPFASRLLLAVGSFIDSHPLAALGAAAVLVAAVVQVVRSHAARARALRALQRIPRLQAILHASELARMYRTLALLIHGGVPIAAALPIVRGLLEGETAQRMDDARNAIAEGRPFSQSLREAGLSTVVADRFFRVGEQSGKLAEMIDRAADFHEEEVARSAEWVMRLVGPVMMLVMGGIIGAVVVLMYLPIFQLAEAIG